MTLNRQDLATGAIFVGFGLFFGISSIANLPIGTPLRMGPGFFPVILAGALVLVGVIVVLRGSAAAEIAARAIPWRALIVLLPLPVFFGATIRGLGLIPTSFVIAFAATFASRKGTVLLALALAVGLTAFSVGVFYYGLGVPVRLLGKWFGTWAESFE